MSVEQNYRGRLAPSPTGGVHLGHARTYLLAYLRARAHQGRLVMRIEDIDTGRSRTHYRDQILEELEWLGLTWDEGPTLGTVDTPQARSYIQSHRYTHYQSAFDTLMASNALFACSCSRKDLRALASAPHQSDASSHYPGTCYTSPSKDTDMLAHRFRASHAAAMPNSFTDLYHGRISQQAPLNDFVIKRRDGLWAYQLAVVVDDHQMNITEVVRGDDLLQPTFQQLALYKALDIKAPQFFHAPLVYDSKGTRLASRHRALTLTDLKAQGIDSSTLLSALAQSLGLPVAPNTCLEHIKEAYQQQLIEPHDTYIQTQVNLPSEPLNDSTISTS